MVPAKPTSEWIKRGRHLLSAGGPHSQSQATRHCRGPCRSFPEAAASFHRLPPLLFLEGSTRSSEREREKNGDSARYDDGDDEGVEGGGGGAVAARLRQRQRGGRPAGEAAPVRGDGDAEPLLLLPPRQPGAPGAQPNPR